MPGTHKQPANQPPMGTFMRPECGTTTKLPFNEWVNDWQKIGNQSMNHDELEDVVVLQNS